MSNSLKLMLAVVTVAIASAVVTNAVIRSGNDQVRTGSGELLVGMVVEGIQIHQIDSSPEALQIVGERPRCLEFPIVASRWIETPWIGRHLWLPFVEGLSREEEVLPRGFSFEPDWAIEFDNGDHVITMLISSSDKLAMFTSGATRDFHKITSFPTDTFQAAISGDYESIPGWSAEPEPVASPNPVWKWESGGATPSWKSKVNPRSEQGGADQPTAAVDLKSE